MDWIEVNGACLRYDLGGRGTETLLLVHELGGALESWDETLPRLQAHFRVLRYDQRGFGLSEKARGTLALETMVGDIVALLDALGIGAPCHVIGSALGAGIAIALAAWHPQRVARLVACNPATGVSGDRAAMLEERAAAVEAGGMRAYAERSLNNSYPEVLRGDRERFERYRKRWIGNDPFGFAAINRMLMHMDLAADYGRIRCPTLVLSGAHDKLRPTPVVKAIADAIPGARFREIDSGHFMAVQTPELFLQTVLPFLRGEG